MQTATASGLLDSLGLSPRGGEHSVQLCEAVLDMAASPGRYGLHPADALQAVRLYYAS